MSKKVSVKKDFL